MERRSGQALVETALAAPFLVMLLLGGAQVGQIAYAQVSLDSAAREGAAAAATNPTLTAKSGGTAWYPGTTVHKCTSGDFNVSPVNPACAAVYKSGGYLDQTQFTSGNATVTLTIVTQAGLSGFHAHPPSARLAGQQQPLPEAASPFPCGGSQALITGTVTNMPSGSTATLSDSNNDTYKGPQVTSSSPTYQYCVTAKNSVPTENITAQINNTCPTPSYSGATGAISVTAGSTYGGQNISLSAVTCTTTSTTSTVTSSATTATSTATSASTTVTSSVSSLSVTCPPSQVPPDDYITVTVTYPVSVFVPFINQLFQTGSGVRTISASVTYAVYPNCATNGS
jgi:hypothetical protein